MSVCARLRAPAWGLLLPDLNAGELHVSMHELLCKGEGGGGWSVECKDWQRGEFAPSDTAVA